MGQYFTLQGLLWLVNNMFTLLTTNAFTGVTTTGSPTITGVTPLTGLAIGQFVVGDGIPAGATIVAINVGTSTITISANATITTTTSAVNPLWSYGTAGQGITLYVHLLMGVVPVGTTTNWANLTEATYDGYAPQPVTYPGITSTPDNLHVSFSAECMTFMPSDYNVPNTITGLAWTYTVPGASGPTLVAVEPYPTPVPLTGIGDLIRVIPVLTFSPNQLNTIASPFLS